ncbi:MULTISPECIES: hypothetical protein [Vagococcus]|uniref:hypothetical protein n=1 Tax=Vagococcus TaxID=2737 RepID=UPI002FC88EA4
MPEIYGLVEVSQGLYLTFYFVTIELEENTLILKDRTNGKKPLNMSIPLNDIENFRTLNRFLTEEITFTFEGADYKFVEYGNKTISLFSQLLERKMLELVN